MRISSGSTLIALLHATCLVTLLASATAIHAQPQGGQTQVDDPALGLANGSATSPETSELEVVMGGMDFGTRFQGRNSLVGNSSGFLGAPAGS